MDSWDLKLDRIVSAEPFRSQLGSITGLTFKFNSRPSADLKRALIKADVPVFNAQYLFFATGRQWRGSLQGIPPEGITLQFGVPELSGLVEPSVIGTKEPVPGQAHRAGPTRFVPVQPLVERLARRAARWHRLRQKPNKDKKIVLVYYNHGGGKQNIGASYLNVFRSIEQIVKRLRREGSAVEDGLDEARIKELLLASGRNVGAWAPGELDRLVRRDHGVCAGVGVT